MTSVRQNRTSTLGITPKVIPVIIVTDFSQDMRGEDGFTILDYDGKLSTLCLAILCHSVKRFHLSLCFIQSSDLLYACLINNFIVKMVLDSVFIWCFGFVVKNRLHFTVVLRLGVLLTFGWGFAF